METPTNNSQSLRNLKTYFDRYLRIHDFFDPCSSLDPLFESSRKSSSRKKADLVLLGVRSTVYLRVKFQIIFDFFKGCQ